VIFESFLEIVKVYGALGVIGLFCLYWVINRVKSGKLILTSFTAAQLEKKIQELENRLIATTLAAEKLKDTSDANIARLEACLAHQLREATEARERLIDHLDDSREIKLLGFDKETKKLP
jgi:hypothetical protein